MDKTVFLDLDGVLVDFLGGAARWYCSKKDVEDFWPKGEWGNTKLLSELSGVSAGDFWDGLSDWFWHHLEWCGDPGVSVPRAWLVLTHTERMKRCSRS